MMEEQTGTYPSNVQFLILIKDSFFPQFIAREITGGFLEHVFISYPISLKPDIANYFMKGSEYERLRIEILWKTCTPPGTDISE